MLFNKVNHILIKVSPHKAVGRISKPATSKLFAG